MIVAIAEKTKKKTTVSRLMKISGLQANVDKLGQHTEELFGLNS
jgi:hypothetical protein